MISEIVTQVPYIGPEPPENPEAGRLWQDEADPPVLREWNGSAWITAADKTTVISSAVQQTKDGITMDFLNDKVSSYMEFTAEGLAIYDSPKGTEGRKTVFGYDTVEQVLKMVGRYTSEAYDGGNRIIRAHIDKFEHNYRGGSSNNSIVGFRVSNSNDENDTFYVGKRVNTYGDYEYGMGFVHAPDYLAITCTPNGDQVPIISIEAINPNATSRSAEILVRHDYFPDYQLDSSSIDMSADALTFNNEPVWHKGNLKIAHGTVWIAPQSAGVPVYVDVNYASTGFSGVPAILATPWTAIPQTTYVGISNPTSTTCKVYGVRTGGTGGFTVAWLAIGV